MPRDAPLPSGAAAVKQSAPAPAALPYSVCVGKLHSQTNDSDGVSSRPIGQHPPVQKLSL
jgi:hypothetical protein